MDIQSKNGYLIKYSDKIICQAYKGNKVYFAKVAKSNDSSIYVESNFNIRVNNHKNRSDFIKENKIKYMPIPKFLDHGVKNNLRYIVYKRYGINLIDAINKYYAKERELSDDIFNKISKDTIHAIEFIHRNGYIHCDIKPDNIILNKGGDLKNFKRVYLIDFDVVTRATSRQNELLGTIEYCSTDQHNKIIVKKNDIESLGYTLLKLRNIDLPWFKYKNKKQIYEEKLKFKKNINKTIKNKSLIRYFEYLESINDNIDYKYLREIFD